MKHYLVKNNPSKTLYVLLLGWGMDEKPILPLIEQENVLMLFDAKDLEIDFDFSQFETFYVLAFSYGVMELALLQDKLPDFKQKVAINGTSEMDNPDQGLPQASRKAMRDLTMDNYWDFRKEWLTETEEEYAKFNANAPWRTIEDCMEELDKLEQMETLRPQKVQFDKIYIAKHDKMIPTDNQLKAWSGQKVSLIEGNHFCLYQFKNIAELFDN